ncbi:MAG TPA: lyase family protein, partial [Puia sp.]|nr:lyase family protein [Puia sp.]
MKLWDKKGSGINEQIEKFTVGRDPEFDIVLAKYDVLGSMAHVQMLESVKMLNKDEAEAIQKELKNIELEIKQGSFRIETGVEDVHSQIELNLTRKIGEAGKKIHTGRSRNDQIAVDIKLYLRNEIL